MDSFECECGKCSLMAVLARLSSPRKIIDFRVTFSKTVVNAYANTNADADQGECGEAYTESQLFCGYLGRAGCYMYVCSTVQVCEYASILIFNVCPVIVRRL